MKSFIIPLTLILTALSLPASASAAKLYKNCKCLDNQKIGDAAVDCGSQKSKANALKDSLIYCTLSGVATEANATFKPGDNTEIDTFAAPPDQAAGICANIIRAQCD